MGTTIKYNMKKCQMDLSIPRHFTIALTMFIKLDVKETNSPIVYTPQVYGAESQIIPADGPPPSPLTEAQTKTVQEIIGVFLYNVRAIDLMMISESISSDINMQQQTFLLLRSGLHIFLYS